VIQAGIVHGARVFYGCGRKEDYKLLRVRLTTVYTLEEVVERNRETYHTGPWEPAYRALCGNGTRQRFEEVP